MERNLIDESRPRNTAPTTLMWIVWGNGRRLPHDWGAVHAMMLDHGYAFIRIGSALVGFPADTQEGRA